MATPASSEVFRLCFEQYGNDTELMLQCVVQELTVKIEQPHPSKGTTAWLLVIAGALVFVMQLGFAMLCAGCVRKKNVANTLLKSVLDASFAAISFFSIGFALAFGGQDAANGATFVGNANFFLIGDVDFGFWFYEYACASTAVTIVAGTLGKSQSQEGFYRMALISHKVILAYIAERCLMSGYNAYSLFMTAFVYPIIAHAVWSDNGFLSVSRQDPLLGVGAIDFAGSGVVHLTGGVIALIATCTIGARKNRFHDMNGELRAVPKDIPGHSISLQVLGTFILWFGCKCTHTLNV